MTQVSLQKLPEFAQNFARQLGDGAVVCLSGSLGSGKTTFLWHLLREMGMRVDEPFSSPTFTIHNEVTVKNRKVHHVDLYRLEKFSELVALDILDLFGQHGTLTFVEWGDKFAELKPYYTTWLKFDFDEKNDDSRFIDVVSKRY